MKSKSTMRDAQHRDDDDVWAWVLIGAIYCAVTVVVFAPLIWRATHGSL
jgi:hypothetical protein